MILNFWTDTFGQTRQTQIKLLLEEQSDQVLHCLLFHLHVFDKILSGLVSLFEFYKITAKFLASENLGTLGYLLVPLLKPKLSILLLNL